MARLFLNSEHARRHAGDDGAAGHVFGHHAAGADQRVFTNGDAAENRRAAADARAFFHHRRHHLPIACGLQAAVAVGGAGIAVIDKRNVVADEHLVLDGHALANEGVAGNFDRAAEADILLNFDERADFGIIADLAAIEIYESEDSNVLAELDIC